MDGDGGVLLLLPVKSAEESLLRINLEDTLPMVLERNWDDEFICGGENKCIHARTCCPLARTGLADVGAGER